MDHVTQIFLFHLRYRRVFYALISILLVMPWVVILHCYSTRNAQFHTHLDFSYLKAQHIARQKKRKKVPQSNGNQIAKILWSLNWLSAHVGHRCRIQAMRWHGRTLSLDIGLSSMSALMTFLYSAKNNEKLAITLKDFSFDRHRLAKVDFKVV